MCNRNVASGSFLHHPAGGKEIELTHTHTHTECSEREREKAVTRVATENEILSLAPSLLPFLNENAACMCVL